MSSTKESLCIVAVRSFLVAPSKDKERPRESWGVDVLKDFCVVVEASDGNKELAIGHGGRIGRFLIGADPRDTNKIWDQMCHGSQRYGRRGLGIMIFSVIDLALWDLLGKMRGDPVYKLIGGQTKDYLTAYLTGPHPDFARQQGFYGSKVPLPQKAGLGYPIMVDCYTSLTVPYAIKLMKKCSDLDIEWWEEILSPDDTEGYSQLRDALPGTLNGQRENTRTPDTAIKSWLRAESYDTSVVPHGTSHSTVHFCMSQPNSPLIEYVAYSPGGKSAAPVHERFLLKEPLPTIGVVPCEDLSKPGFGLEVISIISPRATLIK
ncbi:MAG: hypothetical protein FE78DRAFT_81674 [Acidomyces sp. 'richmondensis']|nr:MAG: hypothetical protein FE78DRAFT_81674 [Acidomyces sp. 'richmondensis']